MNYEIIRSKRKSISISVDRNGKVTVRAPLNAPEQRIFEFVQSKSDWISKHTASAEGRISARNAKLAAIPEALPILGGMCPVDNEQPYGYTSGKFHLPEGVILEELIPYLRRLYCSIAKETLIPRTRLTADRMGLDIADVRINSAKTRWGSCSDKKVINLSWKLIAADPRLIDYVIVHELCHTRRMNHSAAFWADVEAYIPDYHERRAALKDVQRILAEYGLE